MNSSLNEILSLAFICPVKMKERTKGPQDTVHLSLGHAVPQPLEATQRTREHGGCRQRAGKDGPGWALICSGLCARSRLTKQIPGSDP